MKRCKSCTDILYDDNPCHYCKYLDSTYNIIIEEQWEERLQFGQLLVLIDSNKIDKESLLVIRTSQAGHIVRFDPDVKEQIRNATGGNQAVKLAIIKKLKLPKGPIYLLSCLHVK